VSKCRPEHIHPGYEVSGHGDRHYLKRAYFREVGRGAHADLGLARQMREIGAALLTTHAMKRM
jgi:hypothetical protein